MPRYLLSISLSKRCLASSCCTPIVDTPGKYVTRLPSERRSLSLICHLYLDSSADPEKALHLALYGKCGYPSACNATETLFVHQGFLPHLRPIGQALTLTLSLILVLLLTPLPLGLQAVNAGLGAQNQEMVILLDNVGCVGNPIDDLI